MKKKIGLVVLFAAVGTIVFLGFQFFTKTGIFKVPGVVTYDESLTAAEISALKGVLTDDIVLDYDVKISGVTLSSKNSSENYLLSNILVPVSDFYDARSSVDAKTAETLLISVNDLDYSKKLLAIDGKYFLDEFDAGAFYRYFVFTGEKPEETMEIVEPTLAQFPTKDTVLSFAQTGVTALSRGMLSKLNAVGDATYFAANIKDFLATKDLTHISNEASFSEGATTANICADWRFLDTILAIGTDIVELTGNHNQDCGDEAAKETIDKYKELGMKIVGGGKTATEAAEPLDLNLKNTRIKMLAYNYSTGGYTLDSTPGANFYTEENAQKEISAAKAAGQFVIVDVQYYECSEYDYTEDVAICDSANSAAGQQDFFQNLIDLGADMVIGTSAHQPQTYELYKNKPIFYGLGNLFFDQYWWPGTTRSLIITSYFYNGKQLQARMTPTVYDTTMRTRLMSEKEAEWYINRLNNAW